jgi:chromosome segregation ATPase
VSEDRTKELPGASPFERRVLAEFAALRGEVGEIRTGVTNLRSEVTEIRSEVTDLRGEVTEIRSEVTNLRGEVTEIRTQQAAMAKNIAALDQRMTSLEERVDNRLKETRPIWEAVRAQIEKLDEKFNLFIRDLYDIRSDISIHGKRLDILENRVLS